MRGSRAGGGEIAEALLFSSPPSFLCYAIWNTDTMAGTQTAILDYETMCEQQEKSMGP